MSVYDTNDWRSGDATLLRRVGGLLGQETDEWVTVRVTVKDLVSPPPSDSMAQLGTLTDGSGSIRFVSWEASDQPAVEVGETYLLHDAFIDEYDGDLQLVFRSDTEIEHISPDERYPHEDLLNITATRSTQKYGLTFVSPTIRHLFYPFGGRGRLYDTNSEYTITQDGIVMDADIDVQRDAFYGENQPDWHKQKNIYKRYVENIPRYLQAPGLDVTRSEEAIQFPSLEVCSSCNDWVGKALDRCRDCEQDDEEYDIVPATIPSAISISGTLGGPIETVADIRDALDPLKGVRSAINRVRFALSEEVAFKHLAQYVRATTPFVTDEGVARDEDTPEGRFLYQSYQSDHYGRPEEVYSSLHWLFSETPSASRVKTILDVYDAAQVGFNGISFRNIEALVTPEEARTEVGGIDKSFRVDVQSSTSVSEQGTYSSVDEVATKNDSQVSVVLPPWKKDLATILDTSRVDVFALPECSRDIDVDGTQNYRIR